MTKSAKRNIIVSAILAIIMCASLVAGATFALFTSESKVNIAVTSGKVDIKASISDLKTYSGVNLTGNPATDVLEETTTGTFANGGTAEIDEDTLILDKLTPGDKATFNITVTNFSNVNTKYRTIIKRTESSDAALFGALKFNIGGVTVEKSTIWKNLKGSTDENGTKILTYYECSVELPSDVTGVDYQDKQCGISYIVEAIQGNAATSDNDAVMVVAAEASESLAGKVENSATTEAITIATPDSVSVETEESGTVKTQNLSVASVSVPKGAKIATDATELSLNVYETEKPANFTIKVEESQTSKTLEVEMKGLDSDNDKPLTVRVYIGKGLENLTLYHNDGSGAMNKKDSVKEVSGDQDYYYDIKTGFITMATASFSPFTYVFDAKTVTTAEEFVLALADASIKKINLGADIKIDPASYNVDKRLYVETDGLTIDLGDHTLSASNCTLTIIGNNVTIKNGKMIATTTNKDQTDGSYTMMVKGKGTLIEKVTMIGGINMCGFNSPDAEKPDATATIKSCTITATNYYTVCAQKNSATTIVDSILKCGKGTFFWAEKVGYYEGGDPAATVDAKISFKNTTFEGENALYNTVGVAPIELKDDGNVTTWAHDVYTLEKAFDDESISTVKLVQDIELTKVLDVTHSITIDFCGKTITAKGDTITKAQHVIEVESDKLTFKDSSEEKEGKFVSAYGGVLLCGDNTGFELNDIIIECAKSYAVGCSVNKHCVAVMNSGKIVGGAFNLNSAVENSNSSVTIKGGTIDVSKSSTCGIYVGDCYTLTINGGEFIGGDSTEIINIGSYNPYSGLWQVNVTGGTFTTNANRPSFFWNVIKPCTKEALKLTGGTFNVDPSSDYVAQGYEAVKDESTNTWTVSIKE